MRTRHPKPPLTSERVPWQFKMVLNSGTALLAQILFFLSVNAALWFGWSRNLGREQAFTTIFMAAAITVLILSSAGYAVDRWVLKGVSWRNLEIVRGFQFAAVGTLGVSIVFTLNSQRPYALWLLTLIVPVLFLGSYPLKFKEPGWGFPHTFYQFTVQMILLHSIERLVILVLRRFG